MVILTTGSGLWTGRDFTEKERLSSGCGPLGSPMPFTENLCVLTLELMVDGRIIGVIPNAHSSATMVRGEKQNESKYSIHYDHYYHL